LNQGRRASRLPLAIIFRAFGAVVLSGLKEKLHNGISLGPTEQLTITNYQFNKLK
jgi:hypothetical protein